MKNKNNPGREAGWAVFWLSVYLISLIPVLLLAFYNYPCADDYGYSITARWAWLDTHNIFSVLASACTKAAESWHTWQGTFSSIFLMALQPGIFGEQFYAITPWIMIGALSLSVFYLFRVIFCDILKAPLWTAISASSIYLLFAIQCLIDPTQGLYWYNGAVHYMLPQSALFCLTGLVLRVNAAGVGRERVCLSAAAFLTIYIGGGNLVTGLECGIWLLTGVIVLWLLKRKRQAVRLVPLLFTWGLAFAVNAAAPGNWIREGEFVSHPNAIKAVLLSFYYCLEFFSETWHSWVFWAFILLMLPLTVRAVQRYAGTFSFPMPLLVVVYSYCILSSMFTPSIYASGETGAGRIYNIIYLTFLLAIAVNMIYIYGWYWKKYGGGFIQERDDGIYRLAALGITFFCAALYAGVDRDFFTSVSAAGSIISGEAAQYKEQEQARLELLLDETKQDLAFPEYEARPRLLFYEDIEAHPQNWKNLRMTEYYRKNSIVLMESGEEE